MILEGINKNLKKINGKKNTQKVQAHNSQQYLYYTNIFPKTTCPTA